MTGSTYRGRGVHRVPEIFGLSDSRVLPTLRRLAEGTRVALRGGGVRLSGPGIHYLMSWTPSWLDVLGVTGPRLMAPGELSAATHQPLKQPSEPWPPPKGEPGS